MFDRRHLLSALTGLLTTIAADAVARPKTRKKAAPKTGGKKGAKTSGKGKKGKASSRHHAAPKHVAPPAPPPPPPVPDVSDPAVKAAMLSAFDTIVNDLLAASPLTATYLGQDKGRFAAQKHLVDDRSAGALGANRVRLQKAVSLLNGIDRSQLNAADRVDFDAVMWDQTTQLGAAQRFPFGENATPFNTSFYAVSPYVVSQLTGLYAVLPDFLDSQHTIATKDDADAYVERLQGFARGLDQECDRIRADASRGFVPPDFIINKAVTQLTTLRDTDPAQSRLINSLVERTAAAGIAGDWQTTAAGLVNGAVRDALGRQIDTLNGLLGKAVHDAGVRNLPGGDAYYVYAARAGTSTDLSPRDIHALGLQKVADLSAEIDTRMRALGLTQGTVAERIRAMYADPKYLYPNTDDGKAQLIADLNRKVEAVQARLPGYFGVLPKTKVMIKRIPPAIEAGQAGGYYLPPALDGSRPGTYYINLRDTAEIPSWTLPTLTYHEAIPGHHLQGSIVAESQGLPMMRKIAGYNAYVEGWALYAEQLAMEMGMYDADAPGRVGYLHDALFRAARLVVDTGLHYLGWSREQAIQYISDTSGNAIGEATSEIERYCAWPGQALGYMTGKLTWLKIRDAMKARQGAGFDIKRFHDTGLLAGPLPLSVLEQAYRDKGLIG